MKRRHLLEGKTGMIDENKVTGTRRRGACARLLALAAAALLALLASVRPGPPSVSRAQATAEIRLEPPTLEIGSGGTGTVRVLAKDVVDLYGFELELAFDPTVLEVSDSDPGRQGVQIEVGDLLSPDWILENSVDAEGGVIQLAVCQRAPSEPVSGDGVLAVIRLRGRAPGSSSLRVSNILMSTHDGVPIPVRAQGGQVRVLSAETVDEPETPTTSPSPQPSSAATAAATGTPPAATPTAAPTAGARPAAASPTPSADSAATTASPSTDPTDPQPKDRAQAAAQKQDNRRSQVAGTDTTGNPASTSVPATGEPSSPRSPTRPAPSPESLDPRSPRGAELRRWMYVGLALLLTGVAVAAGVRSAVAASRGRHVEEEFQNDA